MTPQERSTYLGLSAFDLAALTCMGEAEDQGSEGQIAVLSVIKNRHDLWGQDYQSVCLASNQFECFDKLGEKLIPIARNLLYEVICPRTPSQSAILVLAEGVLLGKIPGNVGRATFYKRRDVPSAWFALMVTEGKFEILKEVGAHVFYLETKYA
jgi:hypothetical protein